VPDRRWATDRARRVDGFASARLHAREVASRIAADPVWFAETVLGHDLWSVPKAVMRAIARPRARVAVKGCHASSKTHTAAALVLWAPFAGGIAITTAPTGRQVRRLVWAEVRAMHAAAREPLGGELLQAEFRIAPDLYAVGLSTDVGVNFQGFHARPGGFMLVVLDEAPGVEPAVYGAIEGIRAGGDVRVLALGNPDVASGPFHDVFASGVADWTTFTVDALASPNLEDEEHPGRHLAIDELLALPDHRLDWAPRPYLVTRRFVVEKWREWGEQSPLWQSKVRGQFPTQGIDALFPITWLEAAQARDLPEADDQPFEAGVDVAGPGEDETVLAVRRGPRLVHLQAWAKPDPRGDVLRALAPFRSELVAVRVDSVGQGYYFARHLEDAGYADRVVDVNVGLPSRDPERFANLKAELYWGLMERFRDGVVCGIGDPVLVAQLASVRYETTPRGQVKIESKEDARRRGVRSPDRAEAVMLAFAGTTSAPGWVTWIADAVAGRARTAAQGSPA
jgi:phage terminase large subunit